MATNPDEHSVNGHFPRVLVVDSDSDHTKRLIAFLREQGYETIWVDNNEAGHSVLQKGDLGVLVTELHTDRIHGLRLLKAARDRNPEICAIVITEKGNIDLATEAMRQGAYDFQTKPVNLEKLEAVLRIGITHQELVGKVADLHRRLDDRYGMPGIVGRSLAMENVIMRIRQLAPARTTVLIQGETGTGKDLVAQALHQNSPRHAKPFVVLNCAALAPNLIESELFGHEAGAFTGALKAHQGRFETANGGTLFLDEVSEIPLPTQVKLLRVLQERTFERVGGNKTFRVDARVIAATNRPLKDRVSRGLFREDLYYRLNVVGINLPPLRERGEDIPLLLEACVEEFNRENDRNVPGITRAALDRLMAYDWPGNVRELRNCVEGMVVFSSGSRRLDVSDLPDHIRSQKPVMPSFRVTVGMTMTEIEKMAILRTLESVGYDKKRAAEILDIGLRTLYRKYKEFQS